MPSAFGGYDTLRVQHFIVAIVVNGADALFIVCNVGVFNAFFMGMTSDVVNGANTYDALFIVDSCLKSQQWAQTWKSSGAKTGAYRPYQCLCVLRFNDV